MVTHDSAPPARHWRSAAPAPGNIVNKNNENCFKKQRVQFLSPVTNESVTKTLLEKTTCPELQLITQQKCAGKSQLNQTSKLVLKL